MRFGYVILEPVVTQPIASQERPTRGNLVVQALDTRAKLSVRLKPLITFVEKDGSRGLKATLTEVSYCAEHNFNLLSLTRLLCKGWRIANGDATDITNVHDESGGRIVFDIIIPTNEGAIIACRFL